MINNGYSRMGDSADSSIAVVDGNLRSMDLAAGPPKSSLRSQQQQQQQQQDIRFEAPVPLSRSRSSASQRFAGGGASAVLPAAVKRAFSMRRSSSVRERYWRIHDSTSDEDGGGEDGSVDAREHHAQPPPPPPEEEEQQWQKGRRKKKGKLIRACKRLFGY